MRFEINDNTDTVRFVISGATAIAAGWDDIDMRGIPVEIESRKKVGRGEQWTIRTNRRWAHLLYDELVERANLDGYGLESSGGSAGIAAMKRDVKRLRPMNAQLSEPAKGGSLASFFGLAD